MVRNPLLAKEHMRRGWSMDPKRRMMGRWPPWVTGKEDAWRVDEADEDAGEHKRAGARVGGKSKNQCQSHS